jgi:hypothetical protein
LKISAINDTEVKRSIYAPQSFAKHCLALQTPAIAFIVKQTTISSNSCSASILIRVVQFFIMENNIENSSIVIIQNNQSQLFKISLGEREYAFLDYRWSGKKLKFLHVELPITWQHNGIAGVLVKQVLNFAKDE